ncbi:MAG TPA: queuosine precursor transporter [Polyangiaceae bacterium]|nr:queuosine precursor transporter [Polyangiaceae bacterium]
MAPTLDAKYKLFVVLAGVFTTCLVVGDIIGGKLVQTALFGQTITLTVGMIPFPVTFLLTDLLNEFYGKRAARFVTWVGFAMALLAYAFIFIALQIPMAEMTRSSSWDGVTQPAFDNVFDGSKRMIVASLVAYLIAQFTDIGVFHLLRRRTRGRFLWLRATGSTVISQAIDTFTISMVAWYGLLGMGDIVNIMVSSYTLKFVIALGLTPAIYAGHALVQRLLGLEPVPHEAEVAP